MSSLIRSAKLIRPTLDRVLVQRAAAPTQTASGIYIPDKNAPKPNLATVVAVGPGFRSQGETVQPSVQPGDTVLIPQHGGLNINVEDSKDEFLLFRDSDILAKIE